MYCIYPAVVLFGKPKNVIATGHKLSSGVDGEGTVILSYDGFEAVLMHSKISNSFAPAEIQGEDGTIVLDSIHEWNGRKSAIVTVGRKTFQSLI